MLTHAVQRATCADARQSHSIYSSARASSADMIQIDQLFIILQKAQLARQPRALHAALLPPHVSPNTKRSKPIRQACPQSAKADKPQESDSGFDRCY